MNTKKKPNIIFILIDDMGYKDLSCYGSTFYETPNIDKLAKEGMSFTDAYAACPVCSPTRASIMSGKYPATVGVTDWIGAHTKGKLIDAPYIHQLPLEEKSLAKALKEGGYNTYHIGKWHMGDKPYYPKNHGFDINIAGCEWGRPLFGYFSPYHIETLEDGPDGEFLTDRLTDEAINLIKSDNEKPFFMNLCYYAVHGDIQAKDCDIKRFEKKAKDLGLDKIDPFVTGDYFPCEHKKDERIKRRIIQSDPVYAALIYCLDYNIGKLMDSLKESGKDKNTIIIFTSDNGGLATAEGSPTCNAPLSDGKGWMYEGGVREPLIIKWENVITPGSKCTETVTSPDFYPTLLEAANLPLIPEQHTDGVSFMPLLQGKNDFERGPIYWHYPHYGNQGGTPGSSIRMGDYKLIEFFEDKKIELYNLRLDIEENINLVDDMPDLAEHMQIKLSNWRNSVNAKIPKVNFDYK
ncbi:MAG: sulfatase [Clostridiaceae bacterium]